MKLRKNKKGFTIVELVIVIAVIGVLTAILVPTFVSLNKKANKASDNSLVTNLNTALASKEAEDGAKNATMNDAVQDLYDYGFVLKNLAAKSEEDLLWSMKDNKFYLSDAEEVKQAKAAGKAYEFWRIQNNDDDSDGYSIYAGLKFTATSANVSVGFDAGDWTTITSVNYSNTSAREVVIRTNGDQAVLTIDAPSDTVNFYGFAKIVNVASIDDNSLHVYGAINELNLTSGHVEVEDTGIVFDVTANTGSIDNNGYIAANTAGAEIGGKGLSETYEITSLARLEAFRDAVNSGKNFADKDVILTTNITLKDGWRPIGEGYRDVAASNTTAFGITTFFAGRFDGQNHTISNLNNKGFKPTPARLVADKGVNTYTYGLFALVDGNASFKNLKLENVDFDGTRYSEANADSVGALVGYSRGNLTVDNITVSGSLRGTDAISGVVGRINTGAHTISITNCSNSANIESDVAASGIARFYKGSSAATSLVTISNCSNTGNIVSHYEKGSLAGGISVFIRGRSSVTATDYKITFTQSGNTNKGAAATIKNIPLASNPASFIADNEVLD